MRACLCVCVCACVDDIEDILEDLIDSVEKNNKNEAPHQARRGVPLSEVTSAQAEAEGRAYDDYDEDDADDGVVQHAADDPDKTDLAAPKVGIVCYMHMCMYVYIMCVCVLCVCFV